MREEAVMIHGIYRRSYDQLIYVDTLKWKRCCGLEI